MSAPADNESFRALFLAEHAYVARTLRRLGISPGDVEDVAQEVWLKILPRIGELDRTKPVRPWLFTFARYASLNHNRLARHRESELTEDGPPVDLAQSSRTSAESIASQKQEHDRLLDALDGVDAKYREAFVLCVLDEVSVSDAATILNAPVQTLYSRIHRAQELLVALLRDSSGPEGLSSGATS